MAGNRDVQTVLTVAVRRRGIAQRVVQRGGERLGDPQAWGLDGAAVAAFLGLLWPRLTTKDAHAIAIAAAFVTLVAVPFVPAGIPIILAAVVSGAMAVAQHRRDA